MHGHSKVCSLEISRRLRAYAVRAREYCSGRASSLLTQGNLLPRSSSGEFSCSCVLRFRDYSRLHVQLETPELCDLSSTRIMSQVTAANVTIELFSHFSSQYASLLIQPGATLIFPLLYNRQSNITQMQSMEFTHRYKYYGASDFQGAKIIGSMANGSSPHRVGALKLALREGILGGVFLRCPQRDCLLYTNCGIPRDELGGGPATSHCSRHLVELECSSCRTPIVSKDNRCRVCKRRFTGHPH